MRWDTAIPAWLDLLRNDAELLAALAALTPPITAVPLEPGYEGEKVRIPGFYWFMVTETPAEAEERVLVQLDIIAPNIKALGVLMERRARATLGRKYGQIAAGIRMSTALVAARSVPDSEPGVWHRQLDFRVAPVRGA